MRPGLTGVGLLDDHVYPGDGLCLSRDDEWNRSELSAATIVPWASEWLMYYELWHATGAWLGGGIEHGPEA